MNQLTLFESPSDEMFVTENVRMNSPTLDYADHRVLSGAVPNHLGQDVPLTSTLRGWVEALRILDTGGVSRDMRCEGLKRLLEIVHRSAVESERKRICAALGFRF